MNAFRCSLDFSPAWNRVELIRSGVSTTLAAVLDDPDMRDAIAMTSAELLENAIKHGTKRPVSYELECRSDEARVRVTSTPASALDMKRLTDLVRWIGGFGNAQDAYVERLQEVCSRGDGQGSGLGLVRVAYEGGCALDCSVVYDGRVCVTALFKREGRRA